MWQHTPVSIRGWLLLACGGFGVTHVVGEFFGAPLLPSAGLLAWLSLVAYVLVAGRDAPLRVRIALGAGLMVLGVVAAAPLFSTVDSSTGVFAYAPLRQSNELAAARDALWDAAPALLAYACLALAVLLLPARRPETRPYSRAGVAVAVAGVGLAVVYTALELWAEGAGLAHAVAAAPPFLVAALAFVAAGRTPRRAVTAGLVLLGLAAVWQVSEVLDRVLIVPSDAFLEPGLRYGSYLVAVGRPGAADSAGWALAVALQLVAAAAVTVGCLQRGAAPVAKAAPPPDHRP